MLLRLLNAHLTD